MEIQELGIQIWYKVFPAVALGKAEHPWSLISNIFLAFHARQAALSFWVHGSQETEPTQLPTGKQGLHFCQPPCTGDQAAFGDAHAGAPADGGALRASPGQGLLAKAQPCFHMKQELNAKASPYNEIWDSNHRDTTC